MAVAAAVRRLGGRLTPTSDGMRNILALLMLITISRLHQHFKFLNPLRPAMSLVALAALYALANPRSLATAFAMKTWAARLLVAVTAMACISVPFGLSMGNSGKFVIYDYSKTVLFAFLVLISIRHAGDLFKLVWAVAAAGGALAWLSLFVFKMQKAGTGGIVRIQNAYSYDSNDLGFVSVICLVLAIVVWQASGKFGKFASLIILGGLGAAIARTGSRGAFLALVVVGVALLVLVEGVSILKKVAFVSVVAIGLFWAAPPGYWQQMNTITAPTDDYNWTSETGRKAVFKRGMGYMLRFPITGLGIDNFARAEGMLSARAAARAFDPSLPGIKWSAPHNSFIQAGAEMGIPGMVLYCLMVFGSAWKCTQLRRRQMKDWDKGDAEQRFLHNMTLYMPVAFIAFAVGGSFVSFAYLDPLYVLVAFVGGLFVAYEHRMRADALAGAVGATGGSQAVLGAAPRFRGGLPPAPARQPSALPPPVLLPPGT